jgi:hypothetical protein
LVNTWRCHGAKSPFLFECLLVTLSVSIDLGIE